MGSFLAELQKSGTKNARTANGAVTHSTTTNAVLDFFALAGAKRNDIAGAKILFRKAFQEDRQLAIRALFYLRDVRGGQGERALFRELFKDLIRTDLSAAEKVIAFVPEYGRWDDVVSLYGVGGPNTTIVKMIRNQFELDTIDLDRGKSISLMAKWLPSENASSSYSRSQARKLAADLGISNKEYRKRVVALRQYIGLLEQKMSENDWTAIDYGKLPSQASRKHVKAFKRHDETRFEEFLGAVISGDKKMNAGTVATYEVLDVVRKGNDTAANAIWKSLPDYTNGANALVVADTSGSMFSWGWHIPPGNTSSKPIDVSTSLALYFAERNTGPFKDYFITFSESPSLVKVVGKTLTDKLHNISTAKWGMSTNIEKVFDLILTSAIRAGADAADIPKVIYIISDMEFNSVTGGGDETNYEVARRKFDAAGFQLPHVVFWNVASRNENVPVTAAESNVTLVSGLSQSTFRYVLEGKTPVQSMLDILNGERYAQIVLE
jgi:hypothetical protein